jgi:hypothetical protein
MADEQKPIGVGKTLFERIKENHETNRLSKPIGEEDV